MNSTSPLHGRDTHALGGVLWREAVLLSGVSILAGCIVAFGLWAAFGACPPRHQAHISVPTLGPSGR